jgi:hypothetical protein
MLIPAPRRRRPLAAGLLLVLLSALCLSAATAQESPPARWETLWDRWYTLELAGSTAGWMHETASTDGSRYRAAAESAFKVSRGAIELEVTMNSVFLETAQGKPLELHFVQDMALQSMDTRWVFSDDKVLSISRQGEREIRKEHPLPPQPWLTPMAVHRFWLEQRKQGAEDITYRTISGESGLSPVTVRHVLVGEEKAAVEGQDVPVTVWQTTNSMMPGITSTSKYTAEGYLVQEEVALFFGRMITRLATKEQAMALGAGPAPELMMQTFIEVDKPIENARSARKAVFRLRVREGDMPDLPSAGAQRVEPADDGKSATLTVNIDENQPAAAEDRASADYREPSPMADSSDELIVKLAARACAEAPDEPMARAEAMRRFVYEHISAKDLDTAFASASETARMKTGDCSEHGVLLCAMLRAGGIPARVASGLVYADAFAGEKDIFGWHMWTQALIDGKWVDFDATLENRYDAAHVLTGTSSLSEGAGESDLASLLMLIGNLEIEVIEVGDAAPVETRQEQPVP